MGKLFIAVGTRRFVCFFEKKVFEWKFEGWEDLIRDEGKSFQVKNMHGLGGLWNLPLSSLPLRYFHGSVFLFPAQTIANSLLIGHSASRQGT